MRTRKLIVVLLLAIATAPLASAEAQDPANAETSAEGSTETTHGESATVGGPDTNPCRPYCAVA